MPLGLKEESQSFSFEGVEVAGVPNCILEEVGLSGTSGGASCAPDSGLETDFRSRRSICDM